MAQIILATYTGGTVNSPALLIPSIPLIPGTIEKVRVVLPDGTTDGDAVFQFLINDVDQSLSLTIPDTDDEVDDDGLSIATTEDDKGSLRIAAPMPTALPTSPINVYIYYVETGVNLTGNQTVAGTKTFSADVIVPDEAYDATAWNGSLEVPTKNAVRDKIESLVVGSSDSFKTIAVSGQSDVVADSSTDTLTLIAGTNVTITTNATNDEITIAASGGGGAGTVDTANSPAAGEWAKFTDADTIEGRTNAELLSDLGVTASTAELNILDGVTATAAELNALDGITATVTELNYTDGVTSAIQTQLDAKMGSGGGTFSGDISVPDEAYDATAWNGSVEVPTKNAIRDKIESLVVGSSDSFKTIAVSGQSDVVADSSTDTLTLVAGSNVTITTNAGTDTITIAATGGGGGGTEKGLVTAIALGTAMV
jgi:hypothetical protein